MNNKWTWVDNVREMKDARDDISNSSVICIDTEYDSFRYFRERLCLIQIKTGKQTYLLDPLEGLDLTFLAESFADPKILKIMHAGDNDIRILKRDYAFEFKNIFDTQRAALILGCQYLSLSAVINHYLGIEFVKKKKLQRSQWDMRPLTEEQLNYAVRDIIYLEALHETLNEEIREKGLSEELFRILEDMSSATWREKPFNDFGYKNIKGVNSLNASQKQCLKNLFRWRFQKASETNRALFMILSDQDLIDICRIQFDSLEDLRTVGKLSSEKASHFGPEIIDIVKNNNNDQIIP